MEDPKKLALSQCICKLCPSFTNCNEKIGYCVFGKSKCIKERRGCICASCPVYKKLGLNNVYFCITGKA